MPLYQTFVSLTLPEKNISHFTIIPHSQHHFGSTHIGEQIFSRMKYGKSKISSKISHECLDTSLRNSD